MKLAHAGVIKLLLYHDERLDPIHQHGSNEPQVVSHLVICCSVKTSKLFGPVLRGSRYS